MSGFQRYGLFGKTVNGESGDNDARLFKKYSSEITWGKRIFYRENPTATLVYEIVKFPQELVEHHAENGQIKTGDKHEYIDIGAGFLIFNGVAYQFNNGELQQLPQLIEYDPENPNIFEAQASSIWYWAGKKYVYTCDFDCINTTPITTTTDEMVAGGLAKMQTAALKTQAFNDLPDGYEPKRFDIVEWQGDLYIVDEQDSVPHHRPALVKDCIISMTKLL